MVEYLNSRSTGLKSKNELVLLSRELGVDLDHSTTISHSLVDVGLGNGDLLLVLLLVLAKLGAPWDFEIRFKSLRRLQIRSQSLGNLSKTT